jgi:3-mercaptopyruvate sulfurtransferase SseA
MRLHRHARDNNMSPAVIDVATLAGWIAQQRPLVILDARAHLNDAEAGRALWRQGHIPGARNVPGASLLDAHHAFRPDADLQRALPADGDVIAYCGSGISACQIILAYARLGRALPRLYPGSWSAWSRDPKRPVATNEGSD